MFYKACKDIPFKSILCFFLKISRDSLVTASKGYHGFSQINKPFKFSWINHKSLVTMDGFSKCCEIKTGFLTYESLQMLPWNNDFIIEKMVGRKWCRHITVTSFNICMPETKDVSKLLSLLKILFCKTTVNLKQCVASIALLEQKRVIPWMNGCNWNCDLTLYLWKMG